MPTTTGCWQKSANQKGRHLTLSLLTHNERKIMQVFGLARIGRDCELRNAGNSVVINIALAFSSRAKSEKVTTWVEGALFGKRAEALAQYLLKGKLVSVTLTNVRAETFARHDGTSAYKFVGDVIEIDLCPDGNVGAAGQAVAPPAPRPPPAPAIKTGFDDMDDDLLF